MYRGGSQRQKKCNFHTNKKITMIEQIYNMLKVVDPMERDRVLEAVNTKLEADRVKNLKAAQVLVMKYEKR